MKFLKIFVVTLVLGALSVASASATPQRHHRQLIIGIIITVARE